MSSSPETPARITILQALELASGLLDQNRLADAEQILTAILSADPLSPDALHFMGLLRCQQDRAEEAIALIRKATGVAPNYAEAHHNLGNILRALGRPVEALASFKRTIELAPDIAETHLSVADLLRRAGRRAESVPFYLRAIELQPTLSDAYFQLGKVYHRLGNTAEADAIFRQWLGLDPENPVARHMVAAIGSVKPPDRASDGYVRCEFDEFADTFDSVMTTLGYNGPRQIADALAAIFEPKGELEILDAGCGTGLVGEMIRPWARHLVGVDLSAGMLEQARNRGGYDELISSELTSFFATISRTFDLVVTADTFIYFGDLSPVFGGIARALRPGGHFIFTVELLAENAGGCEFFLQPNGRYSHRESYVRKCLEDSGLTFLNAKRDTIRMELNEPVAGLTVTAVK